MAREQAQWEARDQGYVPLSGAFGTAFHTIEPLVIWKCRKEPRGTFSQMVRLSSVRSKTTWLHTATGSPTFRVTFITEGH